ncbi:MAG TPA: amino acid adenylation domain-containing protein [Burkholderiales bacterium]|nr:amino acid adenylation domain-containing protein [Burkholderiales bacterium]
MTMLLQDLVVRQAERRPHATAMVYGAKRLSYGELDAAANRLARTLVEAGCRKGDRVGFLYPKKPAAMVWMLGILKAGAMHVPLDVASPPERLRRIVSSCEPRFILAAGPAAPLAAQVQDLSRLAWMEESVPAGLRASFTLKDVARAPSDPILCNTKAEDPAHILFTSGSTGMPKGVVITHANVMAFVNWGLKHFGLDHTDRVSGHTPLHFDLSTYDIFGAYAAGAELHVVPLETALLPHRLAEFMRTSRLTQLFSVPSVLNYMAKVDAVRQNDFPELRRVMWCGEVLATPVLAHWMRRLPHARFTNLYGPTETTVASSYYDVPACPEDPTATIPIGVACDGEELVLLNDEIHIGGVGLSPGYWRDPQKTAAAFIPHPSRPGERLYRTGDLGRLRPDGRVEFIGRADTQIKSRGYRIELGEIEAALASLPQLSESAVVAIPSQGFEQWQICCAYVGMPGETLTPAALRTELSHLIPGYMMPARWAQYQALPRNANGKIDRPRLKENFAAGNVAWAA